MTSSEKRQIKFHPRSKVQKIKHIFHFQSSSDFSMSAKVCALLLQCNEQKIFWDKRIMSVFVLRSFQAHQNSLRDISWQPLPIHFRIWSVHIFRALNGMTLQKSKKSRRLIRSNLNWYYVSNEHLNKYIIITDKIKIIIEQKNK